MKPSPRDSKLDEYAAVSLSPRRDNFNPLDETDMVEIRAMITSIN